NASRRSAKRNPPKKKCRRCAASAWRIRVNLGASGPNIIRSKREPPENAGHSARYLSYQILLIDSRNPREQRSRSLGLTDSEFVFHTVISVRPRDGASCAE